MDNQKHILVVDDEEIVGDTLNEILTALGYVVTWLQDGEQAWEKLKQQSFDLILCDIAMPKLDGISLLGHVQDTTPQIPMIMLIGSSDEQIKQQALDLGAKAILEKPIRIKDLHTAINKHI